MSNNMKKVLGALVIIALVGIMLGSFIKNKVEEEKKKALDNQPAAQEVSLNSEIGIGEGKKAPDFTLQTLDGESVTLSELQGKKVILNFWATWCPPCKSEMPYFQDYYEKYAEEDNVEIVAVNLTFQDKVDNVEAFVNGNGLTFPILLMEEPGINNTYKIVSIPSTFMIDTNGIIQKQIIGPLDEEALRNYVSKLD